MSYPGYYNEGKKLEEGKTYSFKFIKLVTLNDNFDYMILEDPYGIRHTMLYDYYRQYGLEIESYVECLVDKINCTGRVFLEPKHPIYKIGERYSFEVNSMIETEEGYLYSVFDCFRNLINITGISNIDSSSKKDSVEATIQCISKGIPELTLINP